MRTYAEEIKHVVVVRDKDGDLIQIVGPFDNDRRASRWMARMADELFDSGGVETSVESIISAADAEEDLRHDEDEDDD